MVTRAQDIGHKCRYKADTILQMKKIHLQPLVSARMLENIIQRVHNFSSVQMTDADISYAL